MFRSRFAYFAAKIFFRSHIFFYICFIILKKIDMKNLKNLTTDYLVINRVAAMTFDKALHLDYQKRCYDFVAAIDKEKLRLSDELLKRWKACIDVEVEINKATAASQHTAKLAQLDDDRDSLVTSILGTAQSQLASPLAARKEAANKVFFNLRAYQGIQSESYSAESAHIHGLLKDAEKCTAELATLGLTEVVDELKNVQATFDKVAGQRVDEAVATNLGTAKEACKKTDEVFELVCRTIEAAYIFPDAKGDRQAMTKLSGELDKVMREELSTHRTRVTAGQSAKAKELEQDADLIEPLLAAFAEGRGLAPDKVSFAGQVRRLDKKKYYALSVAGSKELLWVEVQKGALVVTKRKIESASKESAAKPKKPKNEGGAENPKTSDEGKPHGEATVTPKK